MFALSPSTNQVPWVSKSRCCVGHLLFPPKSRSFKRCLISHMRLIRTYTEWRSQEGSVAPLPGNLGAHWGTEETNGVGSSLQEATNRAKEGGGQTHQSLPSRPGQWPLVHDAQVEVTRTPSDRNPSAGCFLEPWLHRCCWVAHMYHPCPHSPPAPQLSRVYSSSETMVVFRAPDKSFATIAKNSVLMYQSFFHWE